MYGNDTNSHIEPNRLETDDIMRIRAAHLKALNLGFVDGSNEASQRSGRELALIGFEGKTYRIYHERGLRAAYMSGYETGRILRGFGSIPPEGLTNE